MTILTWSLPLSDRPTYWPGGVSSFCPLKYDHIGVKCDKPNSKPEGFFHSFLATLRNIEDSLLLGLPYITIHYPISRQPHSCFAFRRGPMRRCAPSSAIFPCSLLETSDQVLHAAAIAYRGSDTPFPEERRVKWSNFWMGQSHSIPIVGY